MRIVVALALALAGCGFQHGALGTGGPRDGAEIDTQPQVIDAAGTVDARVGDAKPIDAPCTDDDSDGVCNAADDWPCGVKPAEPPATVMYMNNGTATVTTISQVNLGGAGRMAVISTGNTVTLALRLQMTDTACPGNCRDQLEVGWVNPADNTGNRLSTCLFDAAVSKTSGITTNLSFTGVATPSTPRAYDLRANLGQNNGCNANGNTGWWPTNTVPDDTRTFARLCVTE